MHKSVKLADVSQLHIKPLHCYYPDIITQTLPPTWLCQTGLYQNIRQANLCWYCQQNPELSKKRKSWGERRTVWRLESDTVSVNNSKRKVFFSSSWWDCYYFVIISSTFSDGGLHALEPTANTSGEANSVGIVKKGAIWCLSLTSRWTNNNGFTKARLLSAGHTHTPSGANQWISAVCWV